MTEIYQNKEGTHLRVKHKAIVRGTKRSNFWVGSGSTGMLVYLLEYRYNVDEKTQLAKLRAVFSTLFIFIKFRLCPKVWGYCLRTLSCAVGEICSNDISDRVYR